MDRPPAIRPARLNSAIKPKNRMTETENPAARQKTLSNSEQGPSKRKTNRLQNRS
jgi:hypothetical protein